MSSLEEVESLFRQAESLFQARDYAAALESLKRCGALASILQPEATETLLAKITMWRRKCETHLEKEKEAASAPPPALTSSIRHEWFQSLSHLTLSFYVKNCADTDVTVTVEPTGMTVVIKGETVAFGPLYGRVLPSTVATTIKSMKVEVVVQKDGQQNWGGLLLGATGNITSAAPTAPPPKSSKAKDWNKFSVEEDKPEGEQALQALFKDIYAKGSDETRQAMMKSFQESGGTVLSTNHSEVMAKKVEIQPPKGMEAKTWDQ